MKLSIAQKKALDPYSSCWVEASAGTGKTKVLTDRVLSLLLADVRISEILCLTFTKAAGAEMANRLRARLHQWAIMEEALLEQELKDFLGERFSRAHVARARLLFSSVLNNSYGIRIQTIHGFCQSILRTFPLEAGLLPHFKIMNDLEKRELILESCAALWRQMDEAHLSFMATCFSEDQFIDHTEFFLTHKTAFLETPPKEMIENLSTCLNIKEDSEETSLDHFFQRLPTIDKSIFSFKKSTSSDMKFFQSLEQFGERPLQENIRYFEEYKSLFLTAEGQPRKKLGSKTLHQEFEGLASVLEDEALRVQNFQNSLEKRKILTQSSILIQAAVKFVDIYETLKEEKAWVDYDDLIIKTRDLLKKNQITPWILEKLDYKLKHILVDEAQDTNQIQWDLILTLIEEFYSHKTDAVDKTLFVVGDLKQSIYSFQGASPHAFMKAKEAFQKLPRCQTVDLSTSYRSTPAILNFVDYFFRSHDFSSGVGSVLHEVSRHGALGIVELWPLVATEKNIKDEEWVGLKKQYQPQLSRRVVAQKIAGQIEKWFEEGELLHSQGRPLEPRDIMILVRRRDAFMEELVKALKEKNIPVTGLDRMTLLDQLVVKDVLVLCDVVLLPDDDLSLATLLKSPFFGLSEEELFQLCLSRKEDTLWAYLKAQEGTREIVDQIVFLQKESEAKSSYEFLTFVLTVWKGREKLLARLGMESDDVLEELLRVSCVYQETYGGSLQHFVAWVRQQNIEVKRSLEQTDENQVRIMTIHGSKGLQAPVVFLPDTTQIPLARSPLCWSDAPPFLMLADKEARKVPDIANFFKRDGDMQEYYRLLYVALTRAEDRLYICGWEGAHGIDPQSWYALLEKTMTEIGHYKEGDQESGVRRYGTLGLIQKNVLGAIERMPSPLPTWLTLPWKKEGQGDMLPSFLEDKILPPPSLSQQKGVLIHKILQWAVKSEHEKAFSLVEKYVERLELGEREAQEVLAAVSSVLNHHDFLAFFNKNTRTEVAIQGVYKNEKVRRVIDVLTLHEREKRVSILDYKTGSFLMSYRQSPPEAYRQQMMVYKALTEKVYPFYEVRAALLWTEVGWIQEL